MRNIFIATPSYHTPVSQYYASMLGTVRALEAAGHKVIWREWEQCCYVHTARNALAKDFLFSGFDDLLFVDNDLGWTAADMVRLCGYDADIVGAAAPFRHGPEGFPVSITTDEGRPRVDDRGLIEVAMLPTAIMKISRQCLIDLAFAGMAPLRVAHDGNGKETGRYLSFFDFEADNAAHIEFGEDVSFCRKVAKLGRKMLVDPDFTICHFGPNYRMGNLRKHLSQATASVDASPRPLPEGLHLRTDLIEGVGPWVWPSHDHWGWEHPRKEFAGLRNLILAHVGRRGHIVQAGGCCGMYPRLWAESFERVTTFEPETVNFLCLAMNCPSDRIVKIQAALSDAAGPVSIENKWRGVNVGAGQIGAAPGSVPALRLDDFRFDSVDAIQLDCEGHEPAALRGALKTLKQARPVLSIEAPPPALTQWLQDLGYLEVARAGTMPDVIFVHRD